MDEQLYTEDCTQRCWCHPLSGVICEEAGCSTGQQCALRNGSWGCHDKPEVCELRSSLQVSTLSGQQLILEPQLSYSLVSLCDEASVQWFSVISYHGPCDASSSRLVTVFQILLHGSSFAIQDGTVKVKSLLRKTYCKFPQFVLTNSLLYPTAEWTLCIPPTHFAIRGVFVIWCEPGQVRGHSDTEERHWDGVRAGDRDWCYHGDSQGPYLVLWEIVWSLWKP